MSYDALTERAEAMEAILRDLAGYLGVGGFNALTVDPELFHAKIVWGIDNIQIADRHRVTELRRERVELQGENERLRSELETAYSVITDLTDQVARSAE
jgi:hypothetical protein